jgi:cellobiose-specific phosphotransferase system component IIC
MSTSIHSLRYRLRLVRYMQTLGVFSFVCSVFCMYSIYAEWTVASRYIFAVSLLSLLISLVISLVEITQSTKALELELSDIEEPGKKNFFTEFLSGATEKKD